MCSKGGVIVEPSRSMLFEGLTKFEHLLYLLDGSIIDHMNLETYEYFSECKEFIETIKEVWY